MILPRYRRDYDGEFLVTKTTWAGGVKDQYREWIPNNIENHHISGRAAVILSDTDRDQFDYKRLQKHRGGLLGKKRLQTYGAGKIWEDMILDFYISKEKDAITKIVEAEYDARSTVYTNARMVLTYPGRLYLIPQAPPTMDSAAIAVYLAAFDGHREVFILGANKDTKWASSEAVANIATLIESYDLTQFICVGVESNMPEAWRRFRNVSCQSYRHWVSHCDV